MTPPPVFDVFLRLLLAAALGGAIGLERDTATSQPGSEPTCSLRSDPRCSPVMSIDLGAAAGSPDRIAAQVVTGIGFLGAGAILRSGENVHGLTTAATIWVNAAIGMAAGLGVYAVASVAAAITLVVLAFLPVMERLFERRERQR